MLNEDLIYPHSVNGLKKEIRKLRHLISEYKKYDEKRTKYYADKMQELGELQSFFEELKDTTPVELCKKYKNEISILCKKIYLQKIIDLSNEDVITIFDNHVLKERIVKLEKEYKNLLENNKELVYKLIHKTQ